MIELKMQPKQLLDHIPLAFVLPHLMFMAKNCLKMKLILAILQYLMSISLMTAIDQHKLDTYAGKPLS
jgi:hypothetical protein